MSTLRKLQDWYRSQCDGEWEHGYGVRIGTLDNPGWTVTIHLDGTYLAEIAFEAVSYGVGKEVVEGSDEWLLCRVEEKKFEGRGGPEKLEEIIQVFLRWAERPAGHEASTPSGRG